MSIVEFENKKIEFKFEYNSNYVSGVDICRALEYSNPIGAERNVWDRNEALLTPYIIKSQIEIKSKQAGRPKVMRYYDQIGATLFIMKSRAKKAEELQIFIAECFIKFINGEKKPIQKPIDLIIEDIKQNLIIAEKMRDVEEKQNQLEEKVNEIEKKIDISQEEFCLAPSERREVQRLIRKWSFLEQKKSPAIDLSDILKKCWNKLNYQFDTTHYNDIPTKKFPEVLNFLNRKFRKENKKLEQFM